MTEQEQIIYMQARILQMTMDHFYMTRDEAMLLFRKYSLAELIEDNFDLYHMNGDNYVFDDIKQYLKHKGFSPQLSADTLVNSIHLVAMMAISDLAPKMKISTTEMLKMFMESKTALTLYDASTKLWCDGPAAVEAEYLKEINKTDLMKIS